MAEGESPVARLWHQSRIWSGFIRDCMKPAEQKNRQGGRPGRPNNPTMKNELERRTLRFALSAIQLVESLPHSIPGSVIGRQFLKSATAIGANYREAQRAESRADFIHKVAIAEKEAAETEYWLVLCAEAGLLAPRTSLLLPESRELLAILTTIGRNAKRNRP
jgi:four helix bundle protein